MTERESAYRLAMSEAERNGQAGLARIYRKLLRETCSRVKPIPPRTRPKIAFVVDHKGWCGERLSLSIVEALSPWYEGVVIRLGDREHLELDADLYVYRNISWLSACKLPPEIYARTITLCEGERPFTQKYAADYGKVLGVIPLNGKLRSMLAAVGARHVWEPIPNGIDTKSFYPAERMPDEFVVGSAGNFSLDYYDDWKGFSKYIVPACRKAGVKLDWRGWRGVSQTPGERSRQEPLDKMPDWYRSLSCFVLMSKSEGCSGVTFEALASGLPVISTKVGWHGEQNCGITWVERPAEETPENVAAAVDALAEQILWVKKCGITRPDAAARAFCERYSWEQLAPKWKAAIDFYLAAARTGRYE